MNDAPHQLAGNGGADHCADHQRDEPEARSGDAHATCRLEIDRQVDRQPDIGAHAAGRGHRGARHDLVGEHGDRD